MSVDLASILTQIGLVVLIPVLVGLSIGIDRKLTARMQNRVGPPVIQPFLDVIKLFGKQRLALNQRQIMFAVASLLLQAAALALLVSGGDLLIVFFVSGFASVTLVLGAFSACSPYSYFGAQRELLQMIAYEPVLFLTILSIGFVQGSFLAGSIDRNLLMIIPLAVVAMVTVLLIRLQKSPFDISTAHQELISGPFTEFAGPYLGITVLAHWFELSIMYTIISLFFWSEVTIISVAGKILLPFAVLFICILIDNTTARLTRRSMIRFNPAFGLAIIALNLLIIYIFSRTVFL